MGAVPIEDDRHGVTRALASVPRVKATLPSGCSLYNNRTPTGGRCVDRATSFLEDDCGGRWRGATATLSRKRRWARSACAAVMPLPTAKRRRLLLADGAASGKATLKRAHALGGGSVGSPRSLQFALSGVSSADTCHILHALRNLPLELRHLNLAGTDTRSRAPIRTAHGVFGWYNWLLPEDERRATRVIWKSAKQLEAMPMQQLARKLWRSGASVGASVGSRGSSRSEVLCTINDVARVVQSTDRLYGLRDHRQVWVECLFNFGYQVCIGKKELRQFGPYRVQDMATSECYGFLVRPTLARVEDELVVGSMLQCLRAIDPRSEQAPAALVARIVDDLPRFTLQWEDAVVNDLFPPVPLFDQAFAP